MGAITVLAAGFAAWRIPWLPVRVSALFTLVVFILLAATLGSLLQRGAGWIGFALFGWGWLFVSFLSMVIGSWTSTADRMPVPMPITSIWLMEFQSSVLGEVSPAASGLHPELPGWAHARLLRQGPGLQTVVQPAGGVRRELAGAGARCQPASSERG